MKKIFFFARDPGGANVILPIYEKMNNQFETLIYAKDFALQKLRSASIPAIDIQEECKLTEIQDVCDFLKRINPDAIVTGTSLDDYTERYLWKAAENLRIKSFAILDQWMNLGIRFSEYTYEQEELYEKCHEHRYLPYRVLVMDELAKATLMEEGIDKTRIVITGQPHFDTVRAKYQQVEPIYNGEYWNIIFVSEPISQDYDGNDKNKLYWGYNEETIFGQLYGCLAKIAGSLSKQIRMIIRPHPREDIRHWEGIVRTLTCDNIILELDAQNDSFSILKSADIVCGMSSMFLLEAVICEKPILSIEIGLQRENPFVLDKVGISRSVLTEEELVLRLTQTISKLQDGKRAETLEFNFIKDAIGSIVSVIEEEINK